MTDNLKIFDNVDAYVAQGRVTAALDTLADAIQAYPALGPWAARVDELRSGYGYMSGYALQGLPDPTLHERYSELVEAIRSAALSMRHHLRLKDAPTLYYNTLRYESAPPVQSLRGLLDEYLSVRQRLSLASLTESPSEAVRMLAPKAEALERRLFNRVWTLSPLGPDEEAALEAGLDDEALPEYFKSLMVSALLLGLMELYDERRLSLLMQQYAQAPADRSVRALCALLIGLWMYSDRYMSRPLRDRFEALRELPGWRSDVRMATMQFVRSRDTERITRKFNDEVMPGMMKLRPEIDKLRQRPGYTDSPEALEENPQWAEMLDKTGIGDRLRELQELQEDGADVMMATFGRLKTFPFFSEISNWFVPFHTGVSALTAGASGDDEIEALLEVIEAAPMFCDNDKYSIALSLSQIPPSQRQLMRSQLQAQAGALDSMRMASIQAAARSREESAVNYVRSLYRFFKLFRRKGEFADPFALRLNLPSVPLLAREFDDEETLMLIGEFYFKRGYYADALDAFTRLASKGTPSAPLHQKIGYCHQQSGQLAEALEHYAKADMLDGGNEWTLRRMAWCHRRLEQWQQALDCYMALGVSHPDDVKLALNIGLSMVKLKRYGEALNYLYKAEFYGEGNEKATRALAWCTLLLGDYDRCVRYTATVLASASPRATDYLNAGHLSVLTGHPGEAVDHYADALKGMDGDTARLLEALAADRQLLTAFRNIDPHLLDIITDAAIERAAR